MAKNQLRNKTGDKPTQKKKKKVSLKLATPAFLNPVVQVLKDERMQRIMGLLFLLISAYLLIAFTSFLFTWKADQDQMQLGWFTLLTSTDVEVHNWLGTFGGIISHKFIHQWFGISSFIFVLLFFLAGFKILFKVSLLPMGKTLKYSFFALLWVSAAMGVLVSEPNFLGGGIGMTLNNWLSSVLGGFGAGALIVFALLTFLIVNFNLSFEMLAKPFAQMDKDDVDFDPAVDSMSEPSSSKTVYPDAPVSSVEEVDEEVPEPFLRDQEEETTAEEELTAEVHEPIPEPEAEPELEEEASEPDLDLSLEVTEEPTAEETEPAEELSLETPEPVEETDDDEDLELDIAVEPPVEEEQLRDKDIEHKGTDILEKYGEYDPLLDLSKFQFPPLDLLVDHGDGKIKVDRDELEANKNRIVETLRNYNIEISKIKATIGPTVTLYEIVPAAGVRISKIKNLEDDIALSLSALGIRIIAPIPGKGTIGIEVPNKNPDVVSMRTMMASEKFHKSDMALPIAIGKNISNETYIADLAKMPHLLMAGATGQGKSVGLNAILVSLLYKKHPAEIKFVLVDPKKVELTLFNKIERHYLAKLPDSEEAIITDTTKVVHTVNSLCIEMDQRYELLKDAMVRNLKEYNTKFVQRKLNPENGHRYLPYIVLVIDEFADLIMTAGKEIETPIARLAQLARAIGIHLIVATQRPSVNIITGIIKANFPSRIAFRVTSKIDSRTILDSGGADQLIGRGDMLVTTGNDLVRIQCAFVDTPEVEAITDFIGNQQGYPEAYNLPEYIDESNSQSSDIDIEDRDSRFAEAAKVVVIHQQGSASLLQRKMKLGYNRAGRIVDQLEQAGIIGPFEGSKARQVLIPDEASLEQFLKNEG